LDGFQLLEGTFSLHPSWTSVLDVGIVEGGILLGKSGSYLREHDLVTIVADIPSHGRICVVYNCARWTVNETGTQRLGRTISARVSYSVVQISARSRLFCLGV
jgi:hypothetical protein